MGNENKSAQLGMPFGTACNRLRKIVLFNVLKKHGENICVRCSGVIESVEDLSIEHIKPWENVSVDLFWSLDNVAFSHLHCNVPHSYQGGTSQRKIAPEGMAWCFGHKRFETVENFSKNKTKWNGLQSECREFQCRVSSVVERLSYKQDAQGSNP